jgi:hypothetical protein
MPRPLRSTIVLPKRLACKRNHFLIIFLFFLVVGNILSAKLVTQDYSAVDALDLILRQTRHMQGLKVINARNVHH